MKTRLGLLAGLALLALAWTPPSGWVRLHWDYPAELRDTNTTFYVFYSTNATAPLESWTVRTNVNGTNLSVRLYLEPGPHFAFIRASNFWGLGDPSEVAGTPALPARGTDSYFEREP